jgi:hypothetical protein
MASGKEIRISITSALNAAGIDATKTQVNAMARSLQKSMGDAANSNKRHWADIKAAWDLGCAAIRKAWQFASSGLKSAFKFETQTTQFKTLVGNIDEAKRHMQDLKELGDTPPFGLDEFAKASRAMMGMTDGIIGYKKSLELVGDTAAATGRPLEEVARAVGRAFAFIRDGGEIMTAVEQLRTMGAVTPAVVQEMREMQKAGASNAEIWAKVEEQLSRFKGAMAETETTGDGLIGAIQSRWDNIVRAFGNALMDEAKGGLSAVNEAAKELEENGSIEVWANKTIEAFNIVKEGASAVGTALKWVWEKSGLSDVWAVGKGTLQSAGYAVTRAAAGIANGEGVLDALSAANREGGEVFAKNVAQGHWLGKMADKGWLGSTYKWAADDNKSDAEHEAKKEEEIRERVRREKREKEEQAAADKAKREAAEEERIKKSLADAQKKKDEADAKAAAEKKAEEEKKAAEKAAAERARLDAQEAARRERQRQDELAAKIRDHQKLLDAERDAESKTRSAISAAESKLQQAWGWYRDKDSMAAQMAEEKADAEARKQFEKDFARLKDRRRDWRKADDLSVDDEAVRRVALAREEKEAAEKHLAEIEKNTASLAEKLDELLQAK